MPYGGQFYRSCSKNNKGLACLDFFFSGFHHHAFHAYGVIKYISSDETPLLG